MVTRAIREASRALTVIHGLSMELRTVLSWMLARPIHRVEDAVR